MPLIASPRADRHFGSTISWNYGASWKSTKRARGEGRMCKYNIAAYDRRTLPHRDRPEKVQLLDIYRLFPDSVRIKRGSFYGAAAKGCILFYLTADACMRHNDIYMRRPDGQTEKARSENAGVEANQHPQPATRCGFRHAVQRKSILRSQGSSPGPLRDAAPTQGGGSLDCRGGFPVWRFTPHGVSGPGCFPAGGPERLASQASWAQGRAQAFYRGHRVCAHPASWRTGLDHRRLCAGRSGKVWYCGSPPESRAGPVGQKKTAESPVRATIPEGTVEAYEGLRQRVVQWDSGGEHLEGRRVFVHGGFAAWAQIKPAVVPSRPPQSHFPSGVEAPSLDSFATELVRLVAGLVLSTRQEVFRHA